MDRFKSYLPVLAYHLGSTPHQLSEWLRALVQAGILHSRPGKGPGSGVEMGGKTISTLILATLASEYRSEAVERTKDLIKYAPPGGDGVCPYTGADNLRDVIAVALQSYLRRSGKVVLLSRIALCRGAGNDVTLTWEVGSTTSKPQKYTPKNPEKFTGIDRSPKEVTVSFGLKTIHKIGSDVRENLPADSAGYGR